MTLVSHLSYLIVQVQKVLLFLSVISLKHPKEYSQSIRINLIIIDMVTLLESQMFKVCLKSMAMTLVPLKSLINVHSPLKTLESSVIITKEELLNQPKFLLDYLMTPSSNSQKVHNLSYLSKNFSIGSSLQAIKAIQL